MAGIILIIFSAVCLSLAGMMRFMEKSNQSDQNMTQATIEGYDTEDYSSRVRPNVVFTVDGTSVHTAADSIPEKGSPEIGSTVTIIYRKNTFSNGRVTWNATILPEGNSSAANSRLPLVMIIAGIVFLAAGLIILMIY